MCFCGCIVGVKEAIKKRNARIARQERIRKKAENERLRQIEKSYIGKGKVCPECDGSWGHGGYDCNSGVVEHWNDVLDALPTGCGGISRDCKLGFRIRPMRTELMERRRLFLLSLLNSGVLRFEITQHIEASLESTPFAGVRSVKNAVGEIVYGYVKDLGRSRRAEREAKAGPKIADEDWKRIVESQGRRCFDCGDAPDRFAKGHLIPITRGGKNDLQNIVAQCGPCNSNQHDKVHIEAFLRGLLAWNNKNGIDIFDPAALSKKELRLLNDVLDRSALRHAIMPYVIFRPGDSADITEDTDIIVDITHAGKRLIEDLSSRKCRRRGCRLKLTHYPQGLCDDGEPTESALYAGFYLISESLGYERLRVLPYFPPSECRRWNTMDVEIVQEERDPTPLMLGFCSLDCKERYDQTLDKRGFSATVVG